MKKHKLFAIILGCQCIFLLLLFCKSLGPQISYAFAGEYGDGESTQSFYLSSGAYEVVVSYEGRAGAEAELSVNRSHLTGSCTLISQEQASAFTTCQLELEENHQQAKAYVWVKTGREVDAASFLIQEAENCTLRVDTIQIQEVRGYRVTRFAGWLLLFVLLDLIWLLLFEDAPFRLTRKQKYIFAALLVMCFAVNLPMLADYLYEGHDLLFHLERINSLAAELQNGQFPVRIETEMLNGYGYVSAIMYGNLFLYLPAVLQLVMVPLEDAYKIYVILVNSATCVLTYYAMKKMLRREWLALTGAFVYTFSAYRLVDVYVRAAVGEYMAMLFLPVLVWGFWNILSGEVRKYRLRDYLPIVAGLTGLLESHVLSCEMAAVFIVITCVICVKKVFQKERFLALAKALVATVLLNLWFLVPFLQYFGEDMVLNARSEPNIQKRGLYLSQVFDIFIQAVGDNVDNGVQDEFGLGIGVALTAGMMILGWYRIRYGALRTEKEKQTLFFWLLGCGAIGMSTTFFPWDSIQDYSRMLARALGTVQFPWRYLAIATIMLTFSLVCTLELVVQREGEMRAKLLAVGIVMLTCIPTGLFFQNFTNLTDEVNYYSENEIGTFHIGVGEYLLKGTDSARLNEALVQTEGQVEIKDFYRTSQEAVLSCVNAADEPAAVMVPIINYRNYEAVDAWTCEEFLIETGENGQIKIQIPAGYQGDIRIYYRVPLLWRAAELISLLCLIVLVMGAVRKTERSA